jgi:hemerythrin-like domain-containing protein
MRATTAKPTDTLRSEHEVILDVLCALEAISRPAAEGFGLDLESARQSLEFLRNFVDRCHHGKEEELYFQALAARGMPVEAGPLFVMKSEHGEGRALIALMADALPRAERSQPGASIEFGTAALRYVELMRYHIAKENGVLFPIGDGMLSGAEQEGVLRAFESFEHDDMEAGAHERFLGIAHDLVRRLGLARAPRAAGSHACCGHGSKCA